MADTTITKGAPGPVRPNSFRSNSIHDGISVDQGMAVTSDGTLFSTVFAQANAAGTANVAGLAATAGEKPGSLDIQYAGPMVLPTVTWDAITGESGGLTPKSVYYLSSTTAGHITKTAPTAGGTFSTPVGFALDAETMMIQIGAAVGPHG